MIFRLIQSYTFSFLKFVQVGAGTAFIYFLLLWFCDYLLKLNYVMSISIAYFCSTLFHFLANRFYTFKNKSKNLFSQLLRYFVVWIINYFITLFIVEISLKSFHFSIYIGVCISVFITMIIGFIFLNTWVFGDRN